MSNFKLDNKLENLIDQLDRMVRVTDKDSVLAKLVAEENGDVSDISDACKYIELALNSIQDAQMHVHMAEENIRENDNG